MKVEEQLERSFRGKINARNLLTTVEEICKIGPRLMATEAEHKAMSYVRKSFEDMGLSTQLDWIDGVVAWRENYARARVIEPLEYEMTCHAVQGSASTPDGGIVGELIYVGRGYERDYTNKKIGGKIVLHDPPYVRKTDNPSFTEVAEIPIQKGAAGIVEYSEFRGRGIVQPRSTGRHGVSKPVLCVTYDDGVYLKELLNEWYAEPRGWSVQEKLPVRVWIDVKTTVREDKTGNVTGILEGTDLKDEQILLVAHHDGPALGMGANDNASSMAIVLQVAKALTSVRKPRRTIRFITVGGEEYGYVGAEFCANNFQSAKEDIKAVVVLDLLGVGSKHVYTVEDGYGGERRRTTEWLNKFLVQVAEDLGFLIEPSVVDYSSDDGPFIAGGFPTAYLGPRLTMDTLEYHSYLDVPDNLDPNDMKISSDIVSTLLWRLANADTLPLK
jgi:hypothetical protein